MIAPFDAGFFDKEAHADELIVIFWTLIMVLIKGRSIVFIMLEFPIFLLVLVHDKQFCSIALISVPFLLSSFFEFCRFSWLEAVKQVNVKLVSHNLSEVLTEVKAVIIDIASFS